MERTNSIKKYENLMHCIYYLEIIEERLNPENVEINCKDKKWFKNYLIPLVEDILYRLKTYHEIKQKREYYAILRETYKARKFGCNRVAIGKEIYRNFGPIYDCMKSLAEKLKPPITPELRSFVISIIKKYRRIERELLKDYEEHPCTYNEDEDEKLWKKFYYHHYLNILNLANDLKIIPALEYIRRAQYWRLLDCIGNIEIKQDKEDKIYFLCETVPESFRMLNSYLKIEFNITEDDLKESPTQIETIEEKLEEKPVKIFPKHEKALKELERCRRKLFENIVWGRDLVNDYRIVLEREIEPTLNKLLELDLINYEDLPERDKNFMENTKKLIKMLDRMSRRDKLEGAKLREMGEYALELEDFIERKKADIIRKL